MIEYYYFYPNLNQVQKVQNLKDTSELIRLIHHVFDAMEELEK